MTIAVITAIWAIANLSPKKKFLGLQRGFERMASALALQCSTNWAMKTHILGAGQFIEFILTRDRNIEWRWCELRKYKWNEDLTIAVITAILSNCKFKPEKKIFRASTGIRTHGLCVSAAVLYQLSYGKTHILGAGQFIEFILTRDRNIEWRWCELRKYKWNEDLTIAVITAIWAIANLSPKKKFLGLQRDFEPMASALALQCSTNWVYEDPYIGSRPIYWVHLNPWQEYRMRRWCELRKYKWNEDLRPSQL